MTLAKTIILSNLLFHYVLMVVLIGVLISQKFKRDKNEQKLILTYIILCSGVAMFMFMDTLRYFGIKFNEIVFWINPVLAIVLGSLFLWNAYRVKNKINKPAAFVTFLLALFIAAFEIFKTVYGDVIYWLLGSFSIFAVTLLLYYISLDFLIGGEKRRSAKR